MSRQTPGCSWRVLTGERASYEVCIQPDLLHDCEQIRERRLSDDVPTDHDAIKPDDASDQTLADEVAAGLHDRPHP